MGTEKVEMYQLKYVQGRGYTEITGEKVPEKAAPVRPPVLPKSRPPTLPPAMGPGLTTVVLRVQGFPTAQEGVEQKGPVVHSQTQVAWLRLRTSGQVGAKCRHCDELHQFHIRHMTKATVVGVNSSHLERVSKGRPWSPEGQERGPGEGSAANLQTTEASGPQCSQDRPPPCTYLVAFLRPLPAGHQTLSPPSSRLKTFFSLLYGFC